MINEMNLTPYEIKLVKALEECKGQVKHCAKNALDHLRNAWKIKKIDKEMCVFRGITAEEEAASSLFYVLKNQRYQNSKKYYLKIIYTNKPFSLILNVFGVLFGN
jgi:hypothetical protein